MKIASTPLLFSILLALSACGGEEAGPPGPSGPPGPNIVLVKRTVCFGDQTFGSAFISSTYRRYDLSDGSAMVTCYIYHNGESRPEQSVTLWYLPKDAEIKDGACAVSYDVDTVNGPGAFEFSIPPNSAMGHLLYRDKSSPYDGTQTPLMCLEV